jgi:hypothetical protein
LLTLFLLRSSSVDRHVRHTGTFFGNNDFGNNDLDSRCKKKAVLRSVSTSVCFVFDGWIVHRTLSSAEHTWASLKHLCRKPTSALITPFLSCQGCRELVPLHFYLDDELADFIIRYKHCRIKIGKALQRRSEAIRNLLARYNVQAAALEPPRPSLCQKEIVDYSFSHNSTSAILELVYCEAVIKFFKLPVRKFQDSLRYTAFPQVSAWTRPRVQFLQQKPRQLSLLASMKHQAATRRTLRLSGLGLTK